MGKNPPQGLKLEWVKKCILNLKTATNEVHMNPEERAQWASTFPSHPEDVQNVPASGRPQYCMYAPRDTPVPRPLASDSTAPDSVFDAPENPPAMSMVFDKDTKKEKAQDINMKRV